jgi:hypothetical protein
MQNQGTHQVEHFDSCFQVIASFMDALQKNFKEDTHYAYPLMPPQANTMYVLDEDVAIKMKSYMTSLIKDTCEFGETEFRFAERASVEGGGLFKLRLEFVEGITFDTIRRILEKTSMLEERVLQRKMAQ